MRPKAATQKESMLLNFAVRARMRRRIGQIHGEIVAATRQPVFYRAYGILDTFEGRFELLTLHAALGLRRLNQLPAPGPVMAQKLADALFAGLDDAMREMGVGDSVLPKRIGRMLEAFTGRMLAYAQALDGADGLAQVLVRNVLAGQGDGLRLARYVQICASNLAKMDIKGFEKAAMPFPDPEKIT